MSADANLVARAARRRADELERAAHTEEAEGRDSRDSRRWAAELRKLAVTISELIAEEHR